MSNDAKAKNGIYRASSLLLLIMLVIAVCLSAYTLRENRKTQRKLDRFWENARREVYRRVEVLRAQNEAEKRGGVAHRKLMHGDRTKRDVALTFDDGPHPGYTAKLLAILARYKVPATFFVVGEMAEKYPDLVKREVAGGHDVGNHTYHHVNLTKIPLEDAAVEIKACGQVLQKILGAPPHLFRPPGGDYDREVACAAEALGYTTILWTDDPGDYASPGEGLLKSRIFRDIGNGGILLLHDGIQETLDILPVIIEKLEAQGYRFITVDRMMAEKGASPRVSEKSR